MRGATPYGMAVGGDGNIWFVENASRIDRTTGKFDEHLLSGKHPLAHKLCADG